MGRRLDGFDVELEFGKDGEVSRVNYHDSEGCGHEQEFNLDNDVRSLVRYHIDHYKRSHRMTPPRMCGFSVSIEGGGRMECEKERHDESENHVFFYG